MNNVISLTTRALRISLVVSDPEVLNELERRDDGAAREAFATQALRLGVLALRQASGSLDADVIRREGDQLLTSVGAVVLNQFSLDRKESALSRLLAEVTTSNGKLRSELAEDVGKMAHEFSLDHEGSALQRLSALLTKTSEAVETSLTLDDEASPLARLKREVLDVLDQHKAANVNFQTEVRSTLETFKARREEAVRSPAHGNTFEAAVGELLRLEAQGYGDLYEAVGTTKGQLDRKTGDHVLTLGAESGAPDTRIVCEAKAKKGYTEREALDEIARARKNRDAQVGVVVISRTFAPESMSALKRVGNDLLVVWDSEDVASDLALRMAVSVARALCVREAVASSAAEASFDRIDQSIESIAEQIRIVDDIIHSARLVKRRGEKIGAGAEKLRATIEREVGALQDHVKALRKESA